MSAAVKGGGVGQGQSAPGRPVGAPSGLEVDAGQALASTLMKLPQASL